MLRGWFELTGKRARGRVLDETPLAMPNKDGIIPEGSPVASPVASPAPATPVTD